MDQGHQGHRPLYCAVSTFVQQTQTLGTSKKSVINIRRGGGGGGPKFDALEYNIYSTAYF